MQAGTAPVVADVGVASRLEKPLGEGQVSIDAGLQQRHVGLRRVVDEDIGHVRVGIRKFQRTCAKARGGKTLKYAHTVCPQCSGWVCCTANLSTMCCRQHKMKLVIKSPQISDGASKNDLCAPASFAAAISSVFWVNPDLLSEKGSYFSTVDRYQSV